MGSRGPVPKRSTERAGHRAKADKPDRVSAAGAVAAPPASESWIPAARDWYESLALSGQARFFEPSDWRYAWILAELLSDELGKARRSSEMVKAILSGMDNLGTTEAARRRIRIEVERQAPPADEGDAKVAVMDRYRKLAGDA